MSNIKAFRKLALLTASAVILAPAIAFAGEWTDRTQHESGEINTYKRPNQRSFTGPFDYSPTDVTKPMAPAPAPVQGGKCNSFTFDATKSYDIDRQKLSVLWNFGDGQTSDQPVVTHVYDKAGDYNVTLTVKDDSGMICDTGVSATKVTANFPPVADAGQPVKACVGDSVTFDASGTTASGTPMYKWDFGDGTGGEGRTVTHVYDKPGNYRVRLFVDDGKGTECSTAQAFTEAWIGDRVTVSARGPEFVCTGSTASFSANSTGSGVKYTWDFGDGSTATGASVSHRYEKSGDYTVRVTADNGQGLSCSIAVDSVRVKVNGAPIADAGENLACCVGKSVTFDGSKSSDPDGDVLTYWWDLGDGTTSDQKVVNHTYEKSGNYRVVLTVKDSSNAGCNSSSDSFVATVNTQPEAVIQVR